MAGWIIKTDQGRWKARLSVAGQGTRNKTFNRKIDAEKWLRNEQARLDRSEWTDPRLARTTFAEWAVPWLDTIDPLSIETWVVELADSGLSPSRTRQAHQLLSMILKAAVRARRLAMNPAEGTPLPRPASRAGRPKLALTI